MAARATAHWLLKGVGIALCITLFMGAYFALLRHPQFALTVVPRTRMDHWIGFTPWALLPYVSLWIYIGLAPTLLHTRHEMLPYLSSALLVAVIGCSIFYFFPTAVPASTIDWSAWPAVAFLKSADAAGNACPSLHVAFAVLTAIWLAWLLRRMAAPRWLRWINLLWCLAITWSTIALRQHVLLDVIAGGALGATAALASLYAGQIRQRQRRSSPNIS
ncbi:MAG: phosphatase PAP2 family protein [Xanthomonadales bacterium]|nr:phosphatase PAP2 family protein [Xanthomonadales bacterium]